MPRWPVLAACPLLVATALAACGGEDAPPIPDAPSSTTTRTAKFPLHVQRMGGVAGFNDYVTIQADGAVLARTKKGSVECTLDRASLQALNAAGVKLTATDQPSTPPGQHPDDMVILFSAGTGVASMTDPRVSSATPVVTQLLDDVSGPAGSRKLCT
jgi:hypothetical protein